MGKRIQELDSLRALACLVIMTSHSISILPEMYDPAALPLIKRTPLAIFRAGREAVVFFFILSGFVMALPFLKGSVTLKQFYVVRFCRLWIPYAISLIVAIALAVNVYNQTLPGLSNWANMNRSMPSAELLVHHLFLLGSFPNNTYNPVLWTLVQITRISIVFPFLMSFICRSNWKETLILCFALSSAGFLLDAASSASGWINDYDMTLHYLAIFAIGALLAKHLSFLIDRYRSLTRWLKWAVAILAFLLYTHAYWFFPDVRWLHYAVPRDWIVALAIAAGVTVAIGSASISHLLVRQPLSFLGRISFSIYLYHAIALLTCLHLFYGKLPIWGIWICSWAATFAMATAAHFIVERPASALGRTARLTTSVTAMTAQPLRVDVK